MHQLGAISIDLSNFYWLRLAYYVADYKLYARVQLVFDYNTFAVCNLDFEL